MQSISGFFYIPRLDGKSIPQNCGYVIGERLIEQMLKEQSLEQIMSLRGSELTSAIRRAAAQIVDGLESPNQSPQRNAGSHSSSDYSPTPETPSSLVPRG